MKRRYEKHRIGKKDKKKRYRKHGKRKCFPSEKR